MTELHPVEGWQRETNLDIIKSLSLNELRNQSAEAVWGKRQKHPAKRPDANRQSPRLSLTKPLWKALACSSQGLHLFGIILSTSQHHGSFTGPWWPLCPLGPLRWSRVDSLKRDATSIHAQNSHLQESSSLSVFQEWKRSPWLASTQTAFSLLSGMLRYKKCPKNSKAKIIIKSNTQSNNVAKQLWRTHH